ncbi:MAG: hypothetical protein H0X47_19575 [Nitrospirales bacterium]|nr:hypothetical protein [Nitrospirales bacterium]
MKERANQLVLAPWFECGIIAISLPLLIGCWPKPAIAALAIENINATMVWHSSVVRLPMKPGYVQVEMYCEKVLFAIS